MYGIQIHSIALRGRFALKSDIFGNQPELPILETSFESRVLYICLESFRGWVKLVPLNCDKFESITD